MNGRDIALETQCVQLDSTGTLGLTNQWQSQRNATGGYLNKKKKKADVFQEVEFS